MNTFAALCRNATLEQAQDQYYRGLLSQVQYEAYCWLWRNSTFRFSSLNEQYENTDFTPLFKELMFELHGLIL